MKKLKKIANDFEEKSSTFLCQVTKLRSNSQQQVKFLSFIIIYVCSNLQSGASFFRFEVTLWFKLILMIKWNWQFKKFFYTRSNSHSKGCVRESSNLPPRCWVRRSSFRSTQRAWVGAKGFENLPLASESKYTVK